MAEGPEDFDPTELNKTKDDDDNRDNDDTLYMTPPKTSTSYQNPGYDDEEEDEETSFGGIRENQPLLKKMREKEEAEDGIKVAYPRPKFQKFMAYLKDIGQGIKLPTIKLPGRSNAAEYVLRGGEFRNFKTGAKLPDGQLKNALGPRAEEIVEENDREIKKMKELQNKNREERKFLNDKPLKTPEETSRIETLDEEFVGRNDEITKREVESEKILERMSLRERIKDIFKKHGFTVFAVLSAVGVIIGVIVSNLSKGLSTLGRGLGNGLKTIGKKLGEILPGMIGAIVSFLFKTAGEVIGFLGKNAWLLIMAVVLYFVESIKKKRK